MCERKWASSQTITAATAPTPTSLSFCKPLAKNPSTFFYPNNRADHMLAGSWVHKEAY